MATCRMRPVASGSNSLVLISPGQTQMSGASSRPGVAMAYTPRAVTRPPRTVANVEAAIAEVRAKLGTPATDPELQAEVTDILLERLHRYLAERDRITGRER